MYLDLATETRVLGPGLHGLYTYTSLSDNLSLEIHDVWLARIRVDPDCQALRREANGDRQRV